MKRSLKKLAMLLAVGILLCGCQVKGSAGEEYPVSEFPPAVTVQQEETSEYIHYEQMKGVWISYLEYGWALQGKTEEQFRQAVCQMYDQVKKWGLNTVIVQLRSHGDAYYPSDYYPWSQYVTGTVGGEPGFDPLQILLEEGHARELSVHGWINPYRLMKDTGMQLTSEQYAIRQWYQSPDWRNYMAQSVDGYWYLNPGNPQVQQLIWDGVREIVERYPVDGIQIDDYFYTLPPETYGQTAEQAKANTTAMVKGIYDTIHSVNSNVWFGVSPAGNYLEQPKSDLTQYTDLVTWCTQEGYVDYVAPQIYWDFGDSAAPFQTVLDKWETLLQDSQCRLYTGLAAYKFAGSSSLEQQAAAAESGKVSEGYIYFRYDNLVSAGL